MEDEKQITNEFVAGQNSVILGILNHLQADQRANHRENTNKMDAVLASIPIIKSDIEGHGRRIQGLENYNKTEVEPWVNARKKRKWMWLGWTGGLGAAVTSPVWVTKLIAVLHAAFP